MEIKIGEAQGKKVIRDINKTDELRVLLRVIWKSKTNEVAFNPSEDLKMGDEIRVTVVKISEPPKAEGGEEATAEEVSEPLKTETGEEGTAETGVS
jgi:uncharacterized Zn finger protein